MYFYKSIHLSTKSILSITIGISLAIAITLTACGGGSDGSNDNNRTTKYFFFGGLVISALTSVIIPGAPVVLGYIPIGILSTPVSLESACNRELVTITEPVLSDENGYYQFKVTADEIADKRLVLKVTKDNEFLPACYIEPVSINLAQLNSEETEKLTLETVELIDIDQAGVGSVSGTVFNALDGSTVANAIVKARKDINQRQGIAIEAIQPTTVLGSYEIAALETGNYTLEANQEGFITGYATTMALNERQLSNQDIIITPFQEEGETLIVLTWDSELSGEEMHLDPHLTGPREQPLLEPPEYGTQERFHVFVFNRGNSNQAPFAKLTTWRFDECYSDVCLDSHPESGPSTIIVTQQSPGDYFYYVYDYTNRENPSSTQLATLSKAKVQVFRNNQLVVEFNVPVNKDTSTNQGNLWRVFRMNGDTITAINDIVFESDKNNVDEQDNVLL